MGYSDGRRRSQSHVMPPAKIAAMRNLAHAVGTRTRQSPAGNPFESGSRYSSPSVRTNGMLKATSP